MKTGDESALTALIGVATVIGFAAVLVPVLAERGRDKETKQQLGMIETFLVMAALGAAAGAIVEAVALLHANQPLSRGVPSRVYSPLVVAALLVAVVGVLARAPGDSFGEIFEAGFGRLAVALFAGCLGLAAVALPAGQDWMFGWVAGLFGAALLLAVAPTKVGKPLGERLDKYLDTTVGGRPPGDGSLPDKPPQ